MLLCSHQLPHIQFIEVTRRFTCKLQPWIGIIGRRFRGTNFTIFIFHKKKQSTSFIVKRLLSKLKKQKNLDF